MKNILLTILLVFCCSRGSFGQSAIYVSSNDKVYWGYRDANDPPGFSLDQCKEVGLKGCKDGGGTDCKLYYAGNEQGWWALIRGYNTKGDVVSYLAIYGKRSKEEAEKELKKQYLKEKGVGTDNIKIFSWYVPWIRTSADSFRAMDILLHGSLLDFDKDDNTEKQTVETKGGHLHPLTFNIISNNSSLLDFSSFHFDGGDKKSNDDIVKSVKIGTQVWMAENLNTDKFRNGDKIPEAKTKEEWLQATNEKRPAWCYHNNDAGHGDKYGRLYNWFAVIDPRGLAPIGWHVPTDTEWRTLIDQLGGEDEAAGKMKSADGWNTSRWMNVNRGTIESGFNALPGSSRAQDGTFYETGESGYWWSTSPFSTTGAGWGFMLEAYDGISKNICNKEGLSVRCVKY
jgi:uncharacterized protein (TIGR02145 family)